MSHTQQDVAIVIRLGYSLAVTANDTRDRIESLI